MTLAVVLWPQQKWLALIVQLSQPLPVVLVVVLRLQSEALDLRKKKRKKKEPTLFDWQGTAPLLRTTVVVYNQGAQTICAGGELHPQVQNSTSIPEIFSLAVSHLSHHHNNRKHHTTQT